MSVISCRTVFMILRGFVVVFLVESILWFGVARSDARTWIIEVDGSGDAPTIQAGIDSACAGDNVLVGVGTYIENINFMGKDVVVRSQLGAAATVLDGSSQELSTVLFISGESRFAVLEGFTVTGGRGYFPTTIPGGDGGGIFIGNAEPTIRSNVVTGNESVYIAGPRETGIGGGILCGGNPDVWSPLIEDNLITGNRAGSNGGGIAVCGNAIPEIVNNVICNNELLFGDGGGIWILSHADGTIIRDNQIRDNLAGDHGGGIYVAFNRASPPFLDIEIAYNIIAGNIAVGEAMTGDSGGGIWLQRTNAWIHHNTIVLNDGGGADTTWGGGIVVNLDGAPLIEQNIIAFSSNGGGIFCVSGPTPTIRNNLTWRNVGGEGNGDCQDWWLTTGNIRENPLFCGMEVGDFSLDVRSPAFTHPTGPLGAVPAAGCGVTTVVKPTTWGSLKARYRPKR